MPEQERRRAPPESRAGLRAQLNEEQRLTLAELERFGWELKFVRHPLFQAQVPVLVDPDTRKHAVLRSDGNLDQDPPLQFRD